MAVSAGVYRSEKHVVVERFRYQFPQRCIWCNSAMDTVSAPAPDPRNAVRPLVCSVCTARRSRLPKLVAIAGAFTLLTAPVAYYTLGLLVGAALLFTALADFGIAWWLHKASRSFRIAREDQQYLWIAGAHGDYLAALPAWHGMRFDQLQNRDGG